jgi:hypothetical protein
MRAEVGGRDYAGTWALFTEVASRSERADILKTIVRIGEILPARERRHLAVAITRLLAPVEWPPEWIPPRQKLISALDGLIVETRPDSPLFSLHGSGAEDSSLQIAQLLLISAQNLLRLPCRRDELRTVALLCNGAVALCLQMTRKAPAQIETEKQERRDVADLVASMQRFGNAFLAYIEAANELNDAVGTVLFKGLFAPTEQGSA